MGEGLKLFSNQFNVLSALAVLDGSRIGDLNCQANSVSGRSDRGAFFKREISELFADGLDVSTTAGEIGVYSFGGNTYSPPDLLFSHGAAMLLFVLNEKEEEASMLGATPWRKLNASNPDLLSAVKDVLLKENNFDRDVFYCFLTISDSTGELQSVGLIDSDCDIAKRDIYESFKVSRADVLGLASPRFLNQWKLKVPEVIRSLRDEVGSCGVSVRCALTKDKAEAYGKVSNLNHLYELAEVKEEFLDSPDSLGNVVTVKVVTLKF